MVKSGSKQRLELPQSGGAPTDQSIGDDEDLQKTLHLKLAEINKSVMTIPAQKDGGFLTEDHRSAESDSESNGDSPEKNSSVLEKLKMIKTNYRESSRTKALLHTNSSLMDRTVSNHHHMVKKLSVGENLHYQKMAGSGTSALQQFDPTAIDAYELDVSKWDKRGWRVKVKQNSAIHGLPTRSVTDFSKG